MLKGGLCGTSVWRRKLVVVDCVCVCVAAKYVSAKPLVSQHCGYAQVEFRHTIHLVMVRKTKWFG